MSLPEADTPRRRRGQGKRPPRDLGEARTVAETARRLQADLTAEAHARWARHEMTYGRLTGAWIGATGAPPRRRFALLADTVVAAAAEHRFRGAYVGLDYADDGEVVGLILDDSIRGAVIPIKMTARRISLGLNAPIGFGTRTAGERILEDLVGEVADFLLPAARLMLAPPREEWRDGEPPDPVDPVDAPPGA